MCSVHVVPPDFDGLLYSLFCRFVAPCSRPWGSPCFRFYLELRPCLPDHHSEEHRSRQVAKPFRKSERFERPHPCAISRGMLCTRVQFNTAEKLPVKRNDKDPSSKRVGIAGCLRPKSMRAGDSTLLNGRGHGSTDRHPCHRLAHLWQRSCASHSQISYKTIPNSACALRSVPLTVSRIASPQMCSPHFPYLLIVTRKPTLDCFLPK